MPTVHTKSSAATTSRNAVRSRRRNAPPIRCAGCGGLNNCTCLDPIAMLRALAATVRELLARDADLTQRRRIRAALTDLVAREEQERREVGAIWRTDLGEDDRNLLDALVMSWGIDGPVINRSVQATAERHGAPIAHARALVDQFFRASRSSTASRRAA